MIARIDCKTPAETREDRFYRVLDEKLEKFARELYILHRDDDASRLVDSLRRIFREAREESKEGK